MNLSLQTEDTIAAVATAVSAGQGGIAVIRISGTLAEKVAKHIVHFPGHQTWSSHKILYGHVIEGPTQELIDEVLVLVMQAPRSFTGEDIVEIHCHGGLIAVERVLEKVLLYPQVRRAHPGEFSERAVINGRLNLTQAEAISDLIGARSQKAAQLAMTGISGDINQKIHELRQQLLDILSELEARVDFEDELPPLNENDVVNDIVEIKESLQELIDDSKRGAFVRNGLKVALIGLPNVGKSSLLNRLSKRERAIVTDLPGTTRDLLEVEIILDGVPLTLIDTAGIRESNNKVEQLGIERSHEALISADVVMLIFDISIGWSNADQKLLNQIPKNIPRVIVGNKSDMQFHSKNSESRICFSALTGEGESDLIKSLLKACGASDIKNLKVALNERQLDLAILAKASLTRTHAMVKEKLPWDFWTIDLREAIHKLGELSGEEITESVLDRIFSRFCIGK